MKENKTKMFTGCGEIFSFTAGQTIKGKGFKSSTLLISVVIFLIMMAISVIPSIVDDGDDDTVNIVDSIYSVVDEEGKYDFSTIKSVYLYNESSYGDDSILMLLSVTADNFKTIDGIEIIDSITKEVLSSQNAVVLNVRDSEETAGNGLDINILTSYNTLVDENEADAFAALLVNDSQFAVYKTGTFDEQNMIYLNMPVYSEVVNEDESIGTMIAKMVIPMVFCFFMYMIILIHGQSISKAVVSDKASKLMEMLLTSVKPYAIIAGKILGIATVAMGQMLIWILSGVIGYVAGSEIASSINPKYVDIIYEMIKIMQSDSNGVAFSAVSIIIAILGTLLGFFMYCVLAGLSGALVSKVEDMSSSSALFQLPVVVAFFIAYFSSLSAVEGGNNLLNTIVNICPLTSPFALPSGILIESMTILEGIVSLSALMLSALILIIITGKIYKGKIFNRH